MWLFGVGVQGVLDPRHRAAFHVSCTKSFGTMNAMANKITDAAVMRPMGWCTNSTNTAAMATPNAARVILVAFGRLEATNARSPAVEAMRSATKYVVARRTLMAPIDAACCVLTPAAFHSVEIRQEAIGSPPITVATTGLCPGR